MDQKHLSTASSASIGDSEDSCEHGWSIGIPNSWRATERSIENSAMDVKLCAKDCSQTLERELQEVDAAFIKGVRAFEVDFLEEIPQIAHALEHDIEHTKTMLRSACDDGLWMLAQAAKEAKLENCVTVVASIGLLGTGKTTVSYRLSDFESRASEVHLKKRQMLEGAFGDRMSKRNKVILAEVNTQAASQTRVKKDTNALYCYTRHLVGNNLQTLLLREAFKLLYSEGLQSSMWSHKEQLAFSFHGMNLLDIELELKVDTSMWQTELGLAVSEKNGCGPLSDQKNSKCDTTQCPEDAKRPSGLWGIFGK